ncbi:MAG: Ig-like domain-containing protein [Cyclobacteriaceae bacterium]
MLIKIFIALLCSGSLISCDTFKEDVTPKIPNEDIIGDNVRTVQGTPNGKTIIDLIGDTQLPVEVSVAVQQQPLYGSLDLLERGLVAYTPNQSLFPGEDFFTYGVFQQDSIVDIDTVKIIIPSDPDSTACYPYVPEVAFTTCQGCPYTFDFEAELCGLQPVGISSYIENNGELMVALDSITYTPRPDFTGYDYFIYRIDLQDEIPKAMYGYGYAIVKAESDTTGQPPCDVIARDDSLSAYFPSTVAIDVLENDDYCGSPIVHIYQEPKYGIVYRDTSDRIFYEAQSVEPNVVDTLRYILDADSKIDSATVVIFR